MDNRRSNRIIGRNCRYKNGNSQVTSYSKKTYLSQREAVKLSNRHSHDRWRRTCRTPKRTDRVWVIPNFRPFLVAVHWRLPGATRIYTLQDFPVQKKCGRSGIPVPVTSSPWTSITEEGQVTSRICSTVTYTWKKERITRNPTYQFCKGGDTRPLGTSPECLHADLDCKHPANHSSKAQTPKQIRKCDLTQSAWQWELKGADDLETKKEEKGPRNAEISIKFEFPKGITRCQTMLTSCENRPRKCKDSRPHLRGYNVSQLKTPCRKDGRSPIESTTTFARGKLIHGERSVPGATKD